MTNTSLLTKMSRSILLAGMVFGMIGIVQAQAGAGGAAGGSAGGGTGGGSAGQAGGGMTGQGGTSMPGMARAHP